MNREAHQGSAENPEISVVISTLGMYDSLRRVLDRLEAQNSPPGSFEVIVSADLADPDLDAVDSTIEDRPFPVRRIQGAIPGLSANRNAGWRAARSPLVMFTDNDTLAEPQCISEHLAWHREHPADEIAVVGLVRWADEITVTPFMRWLDDGVQFDYPNIEGIEAGWGRLYGANCSLKRAFIERVGDFDAERLPYGYEDLDFACRANELGMRLLFNREAVVEHLRPMDVEFWKRRCRRLAVAELQFTELHPDVDPWFHRMFTHAAGQPRAKGRGRHLIRFVPKSTPWLGPRAWRSADLYFRQQLAPHFLEAWNEANETGPGRRAQPDVSERDAEPERSGSEPK